MQFPTRFVLAASVAGLIAPVSSQADLSWDTTPNNSIIEGGTGFWNNLTTPNWTVDGTTNVLWDSTSAIFGGTAGTVTINTAGAGGIAATGLFFNVPGYILASDLTDNVTSDDLLTLTGVGATITANADATISAAIAGSVGLTKAGTGLLTLSGTNTFTGNVVVTGGVLSFGAQSNLGATGASKLVTLTNNATLRLTATYDPGAGSNQFVIGAGGGKIEVAGASILTLNDANQFGGTGDFTKLGTGTLILGQGTQQTYSYTGAIGIDAGTISVVNSTTLGTTTGVTINAGGALNFNSGTTTTLVGTGLATRLTAPVTLNGGTLGVQSVNQTFGGLVTLADVPGSVIQGADFVNDRQTRTSLFTGGVNGIGDVLITGTTRSDSRAIVSFQNTGATASGVISLGDNIAFENKPQTSDGTTQNTTTGKTLGTATIRFQGSNALLDLRDSGTGNDQTFAYGNGVTLDNNGAIVVGNNTTAATGNTFQLGTLTVNGNRALNVTGSSGYALAFGDVALAGNATLNATTASLTLGAVTEDVIPRSITKVGAGGLFIAGTASHTGGTVVEGSALSLRGAADGKFAATTGPITIRSAASLILDNTLGTVNRVPDASPIVLNAGTLSLISLDTAGSAEALGIVTATGGNTINATRTGVAGNADLTLTLALLADGTVNFTGTNLGTDGRIFLGGQTDTAFLGAWATSGTEFAKYTGAGGVAALVDADYSIEQGISSYAPGVNIKRTGNLTDTLTAPTAIQSLNFANPVGVTPVVALGGNTLTIESGAILNSALGNSTISGSAGNALTSGTDQLVLTDNTAGGSVLTISATIANNGATPLTLIKAGSAANDRVVLASANNFTGGTVINGGILQANVATSLGAAGSAVTLAGGQLDLKSNSATNFGANVTVTANSIIDVNFLTSGTNQIHSLGNLAIGNQTLTVLGGNGFSLTINGTTTLSDTATFNNASATFRLNGAVSGPGGLIKTGAGFMSLIGPAANTYAGLTTVTAGTLSLGKTVGVTAIPGDILITGGELGLTAADQIPTSSLITMTGGSLRFGNGTSANFNETVGTINASNGTIQGSAVVPAGGSHTVNIGTVSITGNANLSQNSGSTWNVGTVTTNTSNTAITLNGNSTQQPTHMVIGAGGLTLKGNSVSLNQGATVGTLGSRLTLNGNLTVIASNTQANIQVGGADVNGTRLLDLGGVARTFEIGDGAPGIDLNINVPVGGPAGGAIVKNGAGLLQIDARTVTNTFDGGVDVNAGTLQLFGPATASVSPAGAGSFTLSGGALILRANGIGSSGVVDFGNAMVVDGNARLTVDRVDGTNTANAIQFASLSIGANTLELTQGNSYFTRIAGATTLTGNATFHTNGANLSLAGAIGGVFSITKTGNNTLFLGMENTFNGITINAGIVQANGAPGSSTAVLGAGLVTLGNGTLNLRNDGTGDNGTIVYGNDVLIDPNSATSTISAERLGATAVGNTISLGGLTIGGGAGNVNGNTLTVTGSANGYRLVFDGTTTINGLTAFSPSTNATLVLGGAVTGGVGFSKAGGGTLQLGSGVADGAANTYNGALAASAGTILLNKAEGTDAVAGNVTLSGSATLALSRPNQIGDGATVTVGTGSTFVTAAGAGNTNPGVNETFAMLNGSGGTFTTNPQGDAAPGINTVTVSTANFSAGTNTVSNKSVFDAVTLNLSGGSNTVGASGMIHAGAVNITHSGTTLLTLTSGGTGSGSKVLIDGGLNLLAGTSTATAATRIVATSTTAVVGNIDFNGQTNAVLNIADNPNAVEELDLTLQVLNGSIVKTGAGTVAFSGSTGGNTISGLRIDEGTVVVRGNASGNNLGTGLVTLNGGTLSTRYNGAGGNTAAPFLNANSNLAVTADSTLEVRNNTANTGNTMQFGTLAIGSQTLMLIGANNYGGLFAGTATLSGNVIFNVADTGGVKDDLTLTTVAEDASPRSLTKIGAGVLAITGAAGHTGATNINAGTLKVGISGSISGSTQIDLGSGATFDVSAVAGGFNVGPAQTIVANGTVAGSLNVAGLLKGTGSVGGAVTVGGAGSRLAPGTSPGTMDVGTLNFGPDSTFALELGGTTPGDGSGFYSQVNAAGAVTLDGTSTLALSLTPGFSTSPADIFYVLTRGDTDTNLFTTFFANGASEGTLVDFGNGVSGNITYVADWNGDQASSTLGGGNDIAVYNVIPEPGTGAALISGLSLLAGLRRFRRRSA